jgi:hypothetical protein
MENGMGLEIKAQNLEFASELGIYPVHPVNPVNFPAFNCMAPF